MSACCSSSVNRRSGVDVILAIDTATRMIGLALHDGSRVLAESLWAGGRHHTVLLAPEVAMMFRKVNLEFKKLSGVAVALGPGSYTGLRIGMAFAKGLALSHHLDVVGISTFDILAKNQPRRKEPMLVILEAGRGRVSGMWYKWGRRGWQAQSKAETLDWADVAGQLKQKSYICGEMDQARRKTLSEVSQAILASPAACVRHPTMLAELAWQEIRKGKVTDPALLKPIYLDTQGEDTA